MSANTAVETEAAAKPLLPLLNAAPEGDAETDAPAASQCCGGGSCSI